MSFTAVGILILVLLLGSIGAGVPIGVSFIASGLIGSTVLMGLDTALSLLSQTAYYSIAAPTWVCIPLFILMGSFAGIGGFATRAFRSVHNLSRGLPGSLGVATCYSCAAFGAISGSSIAASAIFARLALPEMLKYNYKKSFAVGCIASAGTFASMIPPSMMLIIYALFTQQSVGKLFAAGIIPGLITATVYSAYIVIGAKMNPKLAPGIPHERQLTFAQRWQEFFRLWPIMLIALVVLGGIYTGITTPTEAAAAGTIITIVLGYFLGGIRSMKDVVQAMKESANTTSMIFLINIGALYFSRVLATTRLPSDLTSAAMGLDVSSLVILILIMLVMFFLGMIMVPIGIFALTLPIVFPIIVNLGYDPIWFGIISLKLTEIGAITPPVGLNAYAVKGVTGKSVRLEDIFAGIWPFAGCDVIVLIMMIIFPQIVTFLPNLLFG